MILGHLATRRLPATTALYVMGVVLLLLSASCNRQLNQRNGRYYSAREMVRVKRGERVPSRPSSRPGSRPALPKSM
jgi:hypothetical protein